MKKFKKLIAIFLLVAITNVPGVFAIYATDMANSDQSALKEENGKSFLLDPETGRYLPVNDVTKEFAKISASTPRNVKFEQAFLEHRKNSLKDRSSSNTPVPGGTGYGMYYNDTFKKNYINGSAISYDIICPTNAGGNVSDFLYLTATNRTAKGVEALVMYYSQGDLKFTIYDWAQADTDPWQLTIPYGSLGDYLHQKTINGVSYQVLSVQNRTELVSGSTWRNLVWLANQSTDSYDLVYNYSYTSSTAEQQGNWVGSWGPIVETFQDSYANTNVLGFNTTFLGSIDSSGQWSGWELLRDSQSYIVNGNLGFTLVFLDPNYGFAVH